MVVLPHKNNARFTIPGVDMPQEIQDKHIENIQAFLRTDKGKSIYKRRKETIERGFAAFLFKS
jgi:hypothetical protein